MADGIGIPALTVADLGALMQHFDGAGVDYSLSCSGRRFLPCRDLDGNAVELISRIS